MTPEPMTPPDPKVDVRERIARTVFAVLHPHETWDGFNERFEARGGVFHPMQLQAFDVADAIHDTAVLAMLARIEELEKAARVADGELSFIQGAVAGYRADMAQFEASSKKLGSNATRALDSANRRVLEGIDACARDARAALSRSPS